MNAGKRGHDADVDGNGDTKRQRAGGAERDAEGGGLQVTLLLDVTRDGNDLGDLSLDLKPLQVTFPSLASGHPPDMCSERTVLAIGGPLAVTLKLLLWCRFVRLGGMRKRMSSCSMPPCPASTRRFQSA